MVFEPYRDPLSPKAGYVPEPDAAPTPSASDVLGAAFRQENLIGAGIEQLRTTQSFKYDPEHNPLDLITNSKYEALYLDRFVDARSADETRSIMAEIDKEDRDKAILDAAGGWGTAASMGMAVLDPTSLLPGGAVYKAGRIGWRAGKSALSVGVAAAGATAVQETGLQSLQQTRTLTESALNVAGAAVVGGILGGAVGTLAGRSAVEKLGQMVERAPETADEVAKAWDKLAAQSAGAAARDFGEAELKGSGIDSAMAKTGFLTSPLLRTQTSEVAETRILSARLAESGRTLAQDAEGTPVALGGAVETRIKRWNGPLADAISEVDGIYSTYRYGKPSKFAGEMRAEIAGLVGAGAGKLTPSEFRVEVGKAMRRGDEHPIPQVAEAAKVMRAKVFDPLKERAIEAGVLQKDVKVDTAPSYLTRVYNTQMIIARRDEWTDTLLRWVKQEQGRGAEQSAANAAPPLSGRVQVAESATKGTREGRFVSFEIPGVGKLTTEVDGDRLTVAGGTAFVEREARGQGFGAALYERAISWAQENGLTFRSDYDMSDDAVRVYDALRRRGYTVNELKFGNRERPYFEVTGKRAAKESKRDVPRADGALARMDDAELRDVVDEITDKIIGANQGRIPYEIVAGPRGPLKERTLSIPDELIEPFLESDIGIISRMYTRTMSADAEIAKEFADVDMKGEISKIRDAYKRLIDQAETEKERTRLDTRMRKDVEAIETMRDRMRGTYALPKDPQGIMYRAGKVIKDWNVVAMLGGMTISAVPDLGRPIMVHGLTRTFRDGWAPLVTNWSAAKLAKRELQSMGAAVDMVLKSRSMAIYDVMDNYGRGSKFERASSWAASKFGFISLMAPWNDTMKQISGMVTMTRFIEAAQAVRDGKASAKDIESLSAGGIDKRLAIQIADEFDKAGQDADGVLLPNTGKWKSREAREAFQNAVLRDVDRIIVTPGQDKPAWMSTQLGSFIGQFKSFPFAATEKVFLAGLEQRDANAMVGALLMVTLGAATYAIREKIAGRDLSDDPRKWAVEAFDRSGLTGWFFEANNMTEKLTAGRVGAHALTGEVATRYASRNVLGAVLGPSADLLGDLQTVTSSIAEETFPRRGRGGGETGGWSEGTTRAIRKHVPLQNLFYMRWLFDSTEQGFNQYFGVPKAKKKN
jgi:GNAT superfamily N-acetyltransferase